jgi:hypothetical protein
MILDNSERFEQDNRPECERERKHGRDKHCSYLSIV